MDKGELFSGHFGDSPEFWIYELQGDKWVLVEKRKNTTGEEEEHEEHHGDPRKFQRVMDLLKDVDVLLAYRMGPNYLRIKEKTRKIVVFAGTRDLEKGLAKALQVVRGAF